MKFKIGDKIKFTDERMRYTIQACNERYLVCTKPFNARKTFMYTIVDLKEKIRGRDGYIWTAYDYTKKEEAEEYLEELIDKRIEISYRHRQELNIENFDFNNVKRKR